MSSNLLSAHRAANVTVARVTAPRLDSSNSQALGRQLSELAGERHLRLDLAAVEYLSSEPLGKLIALHKTMQSVGGKLVLENVRPTAYEVFAVTQLTRVLDIIRAA